MPKRYKCRVRCPTHKAVVFDEDIFSESVRWMLSVIVAKLGFPREIWVPSLTTEPDLHAIEMLTKPTRLNFKYYKNCPKNYKK